MLRSRKVARVPLHFFTTFDLFFEYSFHCYNREHSRITCGGGHVESDRPVAKAHSRKAGGGAAVLERVFAEVSFPRDSLPNFLLDLVDRLPSQLVVSRRFAQDVSAIFVVVLCSVAILVNMSQ